MKPWLTKSRSATGLGLIETWLRMVTAGLNGDVDYTPASSRSRTRPVLLDFGHDRDTVDPSDSSDPSCRVPFEASFRRAQDALSRLERSP